ncbi:hypothetical protein ANCDUO_03300 [Ancylostoma duodenale]|uniref:Uncharacterized protein n=1 Tax=Ancylostoma duodenale TaxID=51022 RepID=A0A0C2HA75_9BILA|nr:hypothetical protein ANCDUO_03300 [Ancylostoma duodenale]
MGICPKRTDGYTDSRAVKPFRTVIVATPCRPAPATVHGTSPETPHYPQGEERQRTGGKVMGHVHVLPESEQFDRPHPTRTRRQTCKTKASDDLNKLRQDFVTHCDRENICLPDEDLPAGTQHDRFKELHAARAKKYSAYLTQLSLCYGRLS